MTEIYRQSINSASPELIITLPGDANYVIDTGEQEIILKNYAPLIQTYLLLDLRTLKNNSSCLRRENLTTESLVILVQEYGFLSNQEGEFLSLNFF